MARACAAAVAFRSAPPPAPQVAPGCAASGRAAALRSSGELSPGRASSPWRARTGNTAITRSVRTRDQPQVTRSPPPPPLAPVRTRSDGSRRLKKRPEHRPHGVQGPGAAGLAAERPRSPIPPRPCGTSILMGQPRPWSAASRSPTAQQQPSPSRTYHTNMGHVHEHVLHDRVAYQE